MLKVCAVYDQAIESYGQPIFVPALGAALRSFQDEVNRKESALGAHPEDYSLYHVGDYDERTGLLIACTPVKLLLKGTDASSITD